MHLSLKTNLKDGRTPMVRVNLLNVELQCLSQNIEVNILLG